jgi:outer membrane protein OmpA-like peptidoglycan-associated protein/tetratricopeptide (TPR) repeat protein
MNIFLKTFSICICLFFSQQLLYTQSIDFTEKNFPNRQAGLKYALEQIKKGDYFMLRGPVYYSQALQFYLEAAAFNPNNAELNYLIGYCYLNLSVDKLRALPYLERAIDLDPINLKQEYVYALGQAYQYSLEFDKAIEQYKKHIAMLNEDKDKRLIVRSNKKIYECESGKILVKKPVRVRIDNLGPKVNSKFPDYAPVVNAEETKLMFTSRRDETTGRLVDPLDSLWFEDIYISYKVDGEWADAKNIGSPINTSDHDATINLTPDGKKLIMYRTDNGGDLFESTQSGISWSKPRNLKEINTKEYENHASYSPDGKRIYFISNRKDTAAAGGKDIYYADIDEKGNIGKVMNIGKHINTGYDEDGVFCHPDGKTLYYSSKGHNSMGGFDIFKSILLPDGQWSAPENLGYPINTPDDDVFFVMSPDSKRAYFASYREEGYGDKDIYLMHILDEAEIMASLQFSITDTFRGKLLNAVVEIKDAQTGEQIALRNSGDNNGEVLINLPVGKTYNVKVSSDKYAPYEEALNLPFSAGAQIVARNVQLSVDNKAHLRAYVNDANTKIPIRAQIDIIDPGTGEYIKSFYSMKMAGTLRTSVDPGRDYVIRVKSPGYQLLYDTVDVSLNLKGDTLKKSYELNALDRNIKTILKGVIIDANTKKPVVADIEIKELEGFPVFTYQLEDGKYDAVVFGGAIYEINVSADGYLNYSEILPIPFSESDQEITRNIEMMQLANGSKVVLRNIFFDFDKTTFRPATYDALQTLVKTMNKYPAIKVEISGHTDNVGAMAYNQRLSEGRAKVVVDFLIKNGIDSRRLTFKGYNFNQPIATNETPIGRQLNRRTELKIISVK